jgi:hypothetical protein
MEDETCIVLPQLVECLDAGWHMILLGTSSLHSDRRQIAECSECLKPLDTRIVQDIAVDRRLPAFLSDAVISTITGYTGSRVNPYKSTGSALLKTKDSLNLANGAAYRPNHQGTI